MIAIPALDLRDGGFVRPAVSDKAIRTRVDAVATAREFERQGFRRVHIVDLDAASGRGSNDGIVREAIRTASMEVQVGGGLRDVDGVQDALDAGARWAVIAARAVPHVDLIAELVSAFPGDVILSIALQERRVDVDGWPRSLPIDVIDLVIELVGLPIAAILLRSTGREGQLAGPDFRLVEDAVEESDVPIIASGGIGSIGHLRSLEERGAAGVIIGTALHAGTVNPAAIAAEFLS